MAALTQSPRNKLIALLKKHRALSVAQLEEFLGVQKEFLYGMIAGNDALYRVKYNKPSISIGPIEKEEHTIVTLDGLGAKRCIICSEYNLPGDNHITIHLPESFLNNRQLESPLCSDGIKGHSTCYPAIGVFFRQEDSILKCSDCSEFGAETTSKYDNDCPQKCLKWRFSDQGRRVVTGEYPACNFFIQRSPPHALTSEQEEYLARTKTELEIRTNRGYECLAKILEEAALFE